MHSEPQPSRKGCGRQEVCWPNHLIHAGWLAGRKWPLAPARIVFHTIRPALVGKSRRICQRTAVGLFLFFSLFGSSATIEYPASVFQAEKLGTSFSSVSSSSSSTSRTTTTKEQFMIPKCCQKHARPEARSFWPGASTASSTGNLGRSVGDLSSFDSYGVYK